jgi:vacuolar-type H+-ATPase subunit I/STV1
MIVQMKKVTVVAQEKDASPTVNAMRSLGVLHVEHQIAPAGQDINELHDDLVLVNRAVAILSGTEFSSKRTAAKQLGDWKSKYLYPLLSDSRQKNKESSCRSYGKKSFREGGYC